MPTPTSNAAIARELRTDSEKLRKSEEWVRTRIYGLEDQELVRLRDLYIAAYRQIINGIAEKQRDPEFQPGWTARELAQIERELDAILNVLTQQQSALLTDGMDAGYRQGYYGRAWLLDNVTVQEWSASKNVLLPSEAIRAALVSPYIGTDGWINLKRDVLVDGIKRSVIQSLIQGEGMQKARQRLANELGIKPGQTANFKGAMYRSMLITRTEIMRASNNGALAIYEQNADVLDGWEFVSSRDERVCRICGALDGKVFRFGSKQIPPPMGSHPGCRCTVVPVLKDRELMDLATGGPRETYPQWAARNGIMFDGGLDDQRGADAHGLNRMSA